MRSDVTPHAPRLLVSSREEALALLSGGGDDHRDGRDDVQSVVKRLPRTLRHVASPLAIRAVRGVNLRLVDERSWTRLSEP